MKSITKTAWFLPAVLAWLLSPASARALDHYVSPTGAHVAPFTDWENAATNIQDAIEVAAAGETVWVTNGVYNTGGRLIPGTSYTNRIAVTRAITVRSVNGPEVTTIEGYRAPGTGSIRCAWLTNNATLSGFTLVNGAADNGGGVYCRAASSLVTNCVLTGNAAGSSGGGMYQGTLCNSIVSSNTAGSMGGGTFSSALLNCKVLRNSANSGGGVYAGALTNCFVFGNRATNSGGGIYSPSGTAQNCTIIQNQAPMAAGQSGGAAVNCIIYFNQAVLGGGANSYVNCCIYPVPTSGAFVNSITSDPLLFNDGLHLRPESPCIAHGTNTATGFDIDGQPWANPPSIGCDEADPRPLVLGNLRVLPGRIPGDAALLAEIAGETPYCWWTKDGIPIEDNPHYSDAHSSSLLLHQFNVGDAGPYQVVASNSFGVTTSAVLQVNISCVDQTSPDPAPPYASWDTAASNIQDAIDAAVPGKVILVTNGIYAEGGRYVTGDMTNRVVVDKEVTILGLNGPEDTVIEGAWDPVITNGPASVRCVWLGDSALLGGVTLRNGSTQQKGGGVWNANFGWRESLVACVLTNCCTASDGGAVYRGRLRACTLAGNRAAGNGGGASSTFATGCVFMANSAAKGGGAYDSILESCTLCFNSGTGAGLYLGAATGCVITNNSGLGASYAPLTNCRLIGNTAGCASFAMLKGCFIKDNGNAMISTFYSTNVNCTFIRNIPIGNYITNCIFWFSTNRASSYAARVNSFFQPGDASGAKDIGNMELFPGLLSDGLHLAPDSRCIGAGTPIPLPPTDLEGHPRGNSPSIGCSEWTPEPFLVSQPRVVPDTVDGQAVLTVELAGAATYCSWTRDGLSIEDSPHYAAAHTPNLVIHDFDVGDAGTYQVIATNSFGAITSAVVQVAVACVDPSSGNEQPPYSTWATAAHTIQDAIDAAPENAVVLVADGLYNTGGRSAADGAATRVILDKAITVMGLHGADQTIIEGAWDPATTNGPLSVRCAWLDENAVLGRVTLRDGSSTNSGGGAWNAGYGLRETMIACVITNCRSAGDGGGVFQGRLRDCVLLGNIAARNGGGASYAFLEKCLVSGNSAAGGGGVCRAVVYNCRIIGNTATLYGGGAGGNLPDGLNIPVASLVCGSLVASNQASDGGGVYGSSTLFHSTVIYNRATNGLGGGMNFSSAWNSIVYFNSAAKLDPTWGERWVNIGNSAGPCWNICYWPFNYPAFSGITNNPQLLDSYHIAATSPCRGTGTNLFNPGFPDLDGESWATPPSIGCDEPVEFTGPLGISITGWPEVAVGGSMPLVANLTGRASRLEWDFGDGAPITDASFTATHSWTAPGDYTVTATVFNSDYLDGLSASLAVHVVPVTAPDLLSPVKAGSTFSLEFAAQPGLTYELQTATSLAPPISWQTLQTLYSTGALGSFTDTGATGAQRFYRLRIQ